MTATEAVKVASVLADVDGGCYVCAGAAAEDMALHFPEWDWAQMVKKARGWDGKLTEAIHV